MGVLASQNSLSGESQLPQVKKPFHLSYEDFDSKVHQQTELIGDVIVRFIIDENGKPKMNMDVRWEYELRGIPID